MVAAAANARGRYRQISQEVHPHRRAWSKNTDCIGSALYVLSAFDLDFHAGKVRTLWPAQIVDRSGYCRRFAKPVQRNGRGEIFSARRQYFRFDLAEGRLR
jgi:hypothetical protein